MGGGCGLGEEVWGGCDLVFWFGGGRGGGGAVGVGMWMGAERDAFEQGLVTRQGKKVQMHLENVRARLVALCVVDGEGQRVFKEEDVKALGRKSALALNRVFEVAQRINGLTEKDMEELAGNSASGQSEDSTSD